MDATNTIIGILRDKFCLSEERLQAVQDGALLTGSTGLSSAEMLLLVFEVEKAFGVQIAEENFLDYGLNSLHGLTSAIQRAL